MLRGVELRVEPAASLALFGENGAGKTTLLRVVAGLLAADEGRGAARRRRPRSPRGPALRAARSASSAHRPLVWDGLTARENLLLVARLYGLARRRRRRAALERVGLADRAGTRARDLSQGQRQRLGVARALVASPDLLLLDEPHAGPRRRGLRRCSTALIEGLRG